MVKSLFIIIAVIACIIYLLNKLAKQCFDDTDPDMYYYDNYAVINCHHTGDKTDVVVNSCVTCETIHTICDTCGKVLKRRIDCV